MSRGTSRAREENILKENIILVGFMGTGKTAVGRTVARKLGLPFVDLDREIVRRVGLGVPEIFGTMGEPFFRRVERDALEEACRAGRQVLATGGGAVCDPRNLRTMKESGVVVWLTATPETIARRLGRDETRPLLAGAADKCEKVRELLRGREDCYRRADFAVATDGLTPDEAAAAVIRGIEEREA